MHRVLNKIYLRNLFTDVVTFRDESNEPSPTVIGYSDATVTVPNHPPIIRSKALLVTTHATVL